MSMVEHYLLWLYKENFFLPLSYFGLLSSHLRNEYTFLSQIVLGKVYSPFNLVSLIQLYQRRSLSSSISILSVAVRGSSG